MNNKNEEKIKCIFYMKSGIQIEQKILPDTIDNILTFFQVNKNSLLKINDEIKESIIFIKTDEIESIEYWK